MRSDHAAEERPRVARRRLIGTLFDKDEQADGEPAVAPSTAGRPADRKKGGKAERSVRQRSVKH